MSDDFLQQGESMLTWSLSLSSEISAERADWKNASSPTWTKTVRTPCYTCLYIEVCDVISQYYEYSAM